MLLDGLLALELVEKTPENAYVNTPLAGSCLLPGAPLDQTHILEHRANAWEAWTRLPEVLRTGRPVLAPGISAEERRAFIHGMNDIARESAKALMAAVDLSSHRHLLDIGAGSGAYTAAALCAHPGMRATVFDLPEVLPITRECVAPSGCLDRVSFCGGDLTRDALGEGYDLILVSNVIHSFDWETNRVLVRKCHAALDPGGMLILKDFLRDPDRAGPAYGLLFALHMFLTTEAGDTYSVEDAESWTAEAGFAAGSCVELTPNSRLWMARKPRG